MGIRDIFFPKPFDYQKASENLWNAYQEENRMTNEKSDMSYAVGPHPQGEGSTILFCTNSGAVTTVTLGKKETLVLIDLLQTVVDNEV